MLPKPPPAPLAAISKPPNRHVTFGGEFSDGEGAMDLLSLFGLAMGALFRREEEEEEETPTRNRSGDDEEESAEKALEGNPGTPLDAVDAAGDAGR